MDYAVDSTQGIVEALKAEDSSLISLSQDITLEETLSITHSVDIDLNGYKLWITEPEAITVSKGKVTFKNGTIISEEDDPIVAIKEGTTVTLGADLKINATKCAVYVKNKAKVIVDGAEITSLGDHAAVFVEGSGTAKENTTLDIRSGEIVAEKQTAVSVKRGGILLVKGGKIESKTNECNKNKTASIYLNDTRTQMRMSGGEAYSEFTSAIVVMGGAYALINGGLVSSRSRKETTISIQGANTSLVMSGGKVFSEASDGILIGGIDKDEVNSLAIKGGVVSVAAAQNCVSIVAGEGKPAVSITGGRFHGKLDLHFIEDGYAGEMDDLGYIEVKDVDDIESPIEPLPDDRPCPPPHPGQDRPGGHLPPDPNPVNKTYMLKRPTPVYGSPSRRFVICHITGAVKVVSEGYVDESTGEQYFFIEFVLAGVGGRGVGYILASSILQ